MAKSTRVRAVEATEAIAATIRTLMGDAYSEKRLADVTGIPLATLRRKLAARADFDTAELLLIAEALGTTPGALLPAPFTTSAVA